MASILPEKKQAKKGTILHLFPSFEETLNVTHKNLLELFAGLEWDCFTTRHHSKHLNHPESLVK